MSLKNLLLFFSVALEMTGMMLIWNSAFIPLGVSMMILGSLVLVVAIRRKE